MVKLYAYCIFYVSSFLYTQFIAQNRDTIQELSHSSHFLGEFRGHLPYKNVDEKNVDNYIVN